MNPRIFLGCLIAVGLAMSAVRCKADDCVIRAVMIESVAEMSLEQRKELAASALTRKDKAAQLTMQAINWVEAGLKPEDAWGKCTSL